MAGELMHTTSKGRVAPGHSQLAIITVSTIPLHFVFNHVQHVKTQ